jgi:DNA-binding NarL/FixJ family response regulator
MHRVLIVSDVRIYRDGLAESLRSCADIEVVGVDASAEALAVLVASACPTVVLIDRSLSGVLSSIWSTYSLHPKVKLIVLGVDDREDEFLIYAEAGASGFVTRDSSLAELSEIVRSTGNGELRCSPRMAAALLSCLNRQAIARREKDNAGILTAREMEILRLIEQGKSNKEIAARLIIEVSTVKNHVHHLLEKLKVCRRAEAGAWLRSTQRQAHQARPPEGPGTLR